MVTNFDQKSVFDITGIYLVVNKPDHERQPRCIKLAGKIRKLNL